jgi:Methyltransferase domain
MDRREMIIAGLDLSNLQGLEIGPLSKPLVRSHEGRIKYVDHVDTASLKAKYEGNPYYDLDSFVDVDVIWSNNKTLREAVGIDFSADYIIASHVIEHVPDLVRWLQELQSVLSSTGQIRLAIPDKRFIFDHYRQVSRLSEVLASWLLRETIPGPQAIIDYQTRATPIDVLQIWRGEIGESPSISEATLLKAIEAARGAVENNYYQDAHCWVFTPKSFASIMQHLAQIGLTNLECVQFIDTPELGLEFYVFLRSSNSKTDVIASWQTWESSLRSDDFLSRNVNRLRSLEQANRELFIYVEKIFRYFNCNESTSLVEYKPDKKISITSDLLTNNLWKYYVLGNSLPPATIQFVSNGTIGIYSHPNETAWKLEGGILTLFHVSSNPSVRFDQMFELQGRTFLRGRYLMESNFPIILCLEQWGVELKSDPWGTSK